jgi:DNA-directed RNA polymerase beta subunit
MSKKFQLPDFIEIQRMSFLSLLRKGLSEEFSKHGQIKSEDGDFEIIFDPSSLRFQKPKLTTSEALAQKKTYSSNVYIRLKLIYKGKLLQILPTRDYKKITFSKHQRGPSKKDSSLTWRGIKKTNLKASTLYT